MECCLCKGEIEKRKNWDRGHNAQPLKEGRCCSTCNATKVIPERIRMLKEREAK